jgi:hypothetical protein
MDASKPAASELLRSAEYSELTSPEHHGCAVARIEHMDAFDPRSGRWYGLDVYTCCRRVWSELGGQELPASHSARAADRRLLFTGSLS